MRVKNSLHFSMALTLPQRLLGASVAVLIPLFFCLGLLRQYAMQDRVTTSNEVFQLQFFTQYRLVPPHQEQEKYSGKSSETTGTFRPVVKNSVAKNRLLVEHKATASEPQATGQSTIETQVVVEDIAASKNQNAEANAGNFVQQFKGKSAIAAYQDARSDIQKMADRRAIAMQAERQTKYEVFQAAASNAVIPDCVAKGTSTKLGLDSFQGLLAIPALASAALMGKCK